MEYPSITRHERLADGIVHLIGLVTVSVSSISLMVGTALHSSIGLAVACGIYCASIMASFVSSASYHLLPRHDWRITLRRFDHSAIYALIAGTFTPLMVYAGSTWSYIVLTAVWAFAIPAMIYKIIGENIDARWSLASYIALGWMGLLAFPEFKEHLPLSAVIAIFAGGLLYTSGTFFYAKKEQVYRYAIWHAFVLSGTAAFFFAVWTTIFWV